MEWSWLLVCTAQMNEDEVFEPIPKPIMANMFVSVEKDLDSMPGPWYHRSYYHSASTKSRFDRAALRM
jgi:hypothetical protein